MKFSSISRISRFVDELDIYLFNLVVLDKEFKPTAEGSHRSAVGRNCGGVGLIKNIFGLLKLESDFRGCVNFFRVSDQSFDNFKLIWERR